MEDGDDLFHIEYEWIQGTEMQGIVVGGNIRCFLKLAGTEYMPDLNGKILLLESYSGTVAKMETYLCQLQQMGAFSKAAGIILGTFTEMESEQCVPTIQTLVKRIFSRLLERSTEVLALYSVFHSLLLLGGLLNNRGLSFNTK